MDDLSATFSEYFTTKGHDGYVFKDPITGEVREHIGEMPLPWGEYPDNIEPESKEAAAYDLSRGAVRALPSQIIERDFLASQGELPEGSQIDDPYWITASKVLHDFMGHNQPREPGPMRLAPLKAKEMTPEDYAEWGVGFMSQFNWNMSAMLVNTAKLADAPAEVAKSMYYLMETSDRTGMNFSNFTLGMGNLFKDPTTYVGLGTFGIGVAGKVAGKQMTKAGLKQVLRDIVLSKPTTATLAVGVEGAMYGAADDLARQTVETRVTGEDISLGQAATSAISSAVAGERFAAGLPAVGEAVVRGGQQLIENLQREGEMPTLGSNLGNVFEPILKEDVDNPPPNLTSSALTLRDMDHPLTNRAREIADERIARQRAEQEALAAEGKKPKKISNNVKVEDLAALFEEDHLARHGRKLDPTNPADQDIAAKELAAEIDLQMTQAASGAGWYDADVLKTFEMMSQIPGLERIQHDETARIIWSALAAPTSIGQKVINNTKAATAAVRGYFRTGKVSTTPPEPNVKTEGIQAAGWGVKGKSVSAGMKVINYLIDEYGEEGFVDWWLSPHTKGELTAVRKAAGLSGPPSGVSGTADSMHLGAMVLGDKTGRFSLNINGYEGTTKDVWYSRTYNRVFGQMFGPDDPKTGEKVVQGGPRNQEERRQMEAFNQKVIAEVQSMQGLSEADAQAILWFYEQGLYTRLGVLSRPGSFSEGIGEIHDSLGIRQTIRRSDGTQVETVPRAETEGYRGLNQQERTVRTQRRSSQPLGDSATSDEGPSGPYERESGSDDEGLQLLSFIPHPVTHAKYKASNLSLPKINQVDAASSAQSYHDDMAAAMALNPFGAAVEIKSPEDLSNMRTFRTENGGGFAIKDDGDIVAVFGSSAEPKSGYAMIQAAVDAGGKKLDAFNTVLPRIYMTAGFKPVARIAWNDEFAPPNWDKATFIEFNNGEPDIVFFVHDPKFFNDAAFDMNDVPLADDYDAAVALQDEALAQLGGGE